MPTTVGRSRGRQGVHSGAQGAVGDHMRKIMATMIAATVVIIFVLVATKVGHVIDAATQHFMLYYAGVLALVGLTGSVLMGLVATDRIVMTPGHRVMAQAVHRAFAFGTLAFLIIHITTEILAQRSHVIDAVIPFLSPYRTFYIGLGTIASDLIVLLVVTSILRKRFTGHGQAWRWRAIHYSSYVAFVFGVLHGLLGGRAAKPYVDWSYGFAIAVTALGLAVRFLALSLRPKESLGSSTGVDRARSSGSSPLHGAAMGMAQAQLGGTVQVLPAGLGARGATTGMPGTWTATALPSPGRSPASGPLPALDPAPAYAGPSSPSDAYRDLGFTPLGAPAYGHDVPTGMRGRPYLGVDQPRSALAGPAPARSVRQPLYEPEYDGPPRFEGAPRGHGDVPADDLSSYRYRPPGRGPQSAAPYADDYPDRTGSGGRTGSRPGWPESGRPRAAITAPPRQEDWSSGPMPTLGTGPIPQLGTGPIPRPDAAAMPQPGTRPVPRPDTGPIPRGGNGQPPRNGTGPMPRNGTGPMPRGGTGLMPRADSGLMPRADSGPMPRADSGPTPRLTGPMPRPDTGPMPEPGPGPMPRGGNGQPPRNGTGAMPRNATGPMPRGGTGPMPRPDTGPIPQLGPGPMPPPDTGPMPRPDTRAMPRPDTGPMPRVGTGPLPRAGGGPASRPGPGAMPQPGADSASRSQSGPLPRLGTGPMPRTDTGPSPRPGSGPMARPGQSAPPADLAAGPRTGPLPSAAARPSRRAKSSDPRDRDVPGPTEGGEWE